MTINKKLIEKIEISKHEISSFREKENEILSEIFKKFQDSNWYPICHNDLNKIECDRCMNCWSKNCNRSNCDRNGRCMCSDTSCICLGRQ